MGGPPRAWWSSRVMGGALALPVALLPAPTGEPQDVGSPVAPALQSADPDPDPAPWPVHGHASSGTRGYDRHVPLELNRASSDDLLRLPGVGPTIAAAIVEERARRGGFAQVDDLGDVHGIGAAKLAEIRPLVSVRAPRR